MSDDKLRDRIQRGIHAKQLLENPAFVDLTKVLRDDLLRTWEISPETEKREAAWYGVRALRDLVARLNGFISDGVLAQREVEALEKK